MAKRKVSPVTKEFNDAMREGDRKRYDAILEKMRKGTATAAEMEEGKELKKRLARK